MNIPPQRKRRDSCKPIYLYSREQSFIAALIDAIPHDYRDCDHEKLGEDIYKVLVTYGINVVNAHQNPDLGKIYDIMHRTGENE